MSNTANRVATNTLFQYIELILNVVIGLISVRLILDALGPSDYGIYDLIGGIIALSGFITSSLSQTSMRFLSVSLGEGDSDKTRKVFGSCLWLNIYTALAIAVLLIILGRFIFHGALNIPEDRIVTARAIYHVMIFSLCMNLIIAPFTSLICSHELFIKVSIVRILDSVIKLIISVVISFVSIDKLLIYGYLMVLITLFDFICYFSIAWNYKHEIQLRPVPLKSIKEIVGFAGWTVLDITGTIATRQGYAILLNSFFGTVVNAVFALSRQIEGHMYTISAYVINTIKPQIMKSQGAGDTDRMLRLSMTAGKFGFAMMSLVAIPLLVMMPEVLSLWLNNVPDGTVLFSRLMVIACMIEQLTKGLVYANQAEGNIKWFSITISSIRILALPISYVMFKLGAPAYIAIVVFLICETVGSFSRVFILSYLSDFKTSDFYKMLFFQVLPPFFITLFICILCHGILSGLSGLVMCAIITCVCYVFMVLMFGLSTIEKDAVVSIISSLFKKRSFNK